MERFPTPGWSHSLQNDVRISADMSLEVAYRDMYMLGPSPMKIHDWTFSIVPLIVVFQHLTFTHTVLCFPLGITCVVGTELSHMFPVTSKSGLTVIKWHPKHCVSELCTSLDCHSNPFLRKHKYYPNVWKSYYKDNVYWYLGLRMAAIWLFTFVYEELMLTLAVTTNIVIKSTTAGKCFYFLRQVCTNCSKSESSILHIWNPCVRHGRWRSLGSWQSHSVGRFSSCPGIL